MLYWKRKVLSRDFGDGDGEDGDDDDDDDGDGEGGVELLPLDAPLAPPPRLIDDEDVDKGVQEPEGVDEDGLDVDADVDAADDDGGDVILLLPASALTHHSWAGGPFWTGLVFFSFWHKVTLHYLGHFVSWSLCLLVTFPLFFPPLVFCSLVSVDLLKSLFS